jgi:tetratricopeptide (TPR) repeat protein
MITTLLLSFALAMGEDENRVPAKPASLTRSGRSASSDFVMKAADCLGEGDEAGAIVNLTHHVRAYPDQVAFRRQLAELLYKLQRIPEAQEQFERCIAIAQDGTALARQALPSYHTRLMEIARLRGDFYREKLHQGIGLYCIAERLASHPDQKDTGEVERVLCKASVALKEAQSERPDESRPSWYLYRVWTRLDQTRPAEKALKKALASADFSSLTPGELRELKQLSPLP